MKKLTLTLFLALASLVSFAQSTVKTLRVAEGPTLISESIPIGTQVVLLSTNVVYTAARGIASGTTDYEDFADAIEYGALVTTLQTISTAVQEEELAADDLTYTSALTSSLVGEDSSSDGAELANNEIVKIYINGLLLPKGAYKVTYTSSTTTNTVAITAPLYKYDVVKIEYDTKG